MKYDVVLYYFESGHLNQIYDGFARLQKCGICNVTYKKAEGISSKPLLYALINGQRVLYDTLDGLNWIENDIENNLKYFESHDFNVDYYFKRSYTSLLQQYVHNRFMLYPLGLNYNIHPISYPYSVNRLRDRFIASKLVEKIVGKRRFYAEDFTCEPQNINNRILFFTRLWDPSCFRLSSPHTYENWMQLNRNRIECISACKKYYGNQFIGGIQTDDYSIKTCSSDLLIPHYMTKREMFLNEVKKSSICITTTGLFDSIGWKFAEYIAASRAIVTEPLCYELPGNISKNKNFLEFTNPTELIESINILLNDSLLLKNMMEANYNYYKKYVQPDKLIYNTLLKIK